MAPPAPLEDEHWLNVQLTIQTQSFAETTAPPADFLFEQPSNVSP